MHLCPPILKSLMKIVKEIKEWLSDNFLLLNENKTEAITVMPVNQSAVAKSIKLGDVTVLLSSTVTKKCRTGEHATRVCRSAESLSTAHSKD